MPEIKIKGLVYVKHGRIGTRSEGPDYFLQSATGDYSLIYHHRNLWDPDYELEYFCRRIVDVSGEQSEPGVIAVKHIVMNRDLLIGM